MADETLVIEIKSDTSGLQPTIDLLEKLGKISAADAANFRKLTEATKEQEKATQALNPDLQKNTDALNKLSEALEKKVKPGIKNVNNDFKDFIRTIKEVGAAIGVGLGVAAIVEFGKESFKAFTDAEKTAKVLQTAVSVNGGLQKDFDNLIKQSKELQKISIFSDEDIIRAQTLALQFGLTTSQVEKLIPVIADFASATGQTLDNALEAVLHGTEGMARGLKIFGIEVDNTGTKAQKLASITQQLTDKFSGQAEVVGKTTFGAVEKLKNQFNDLQEQVGGFVAEAGHATAVMIEWILNGFQPLDEQLDNTASKLESFGKISSNLAKVLLEAQINTIKATGEAVPQQLTDRLNQINFDEFQNSIEKLTDKELIDKLHELQKAEEDLTQASIGLSAFAPSGVTKEKLDAINALIKARKIEAGLIADQNKEDDAEAKKRLEEEKKLLDARIKSEEDHFKLAEENLKIFQAKQKQLILDRHLNEDQQNEEFANLELLVLEIRRENYKKFGKDIGDIDNAITDLKIKNIDKVELKTESSTVKNTKSVHDSVQDIIDAEEKKREEFNKTLDSLVSISESISQIFNNLSQQKINDLETQRQAQQDAFDNESQALKDKLDKDLITQAQFDNQLSALKKKKDADDKRIEQEQKRIRQQQAEREKAFNIFTTIINTARAVAEALPNVVLSALAAAIGAAQLAAIISTPIPKFHKGRLAKLDSSEEHAIIRKDETILSPENSKQYRETLAAIHERRISPSLLNNFVRMKVDKMPGGKDGRTSFLNIDIERGMRGALRKGINIKNTNELGKAIADNLPQENIRRAV